MFREPSRVARLELASKVRLDDDIHAAIVRRENAATLGVDDERSLKDVVCYGE